MNAPPLASSFRSRSQDRIAELFDAFGGQVFAYCWLLVRDQELAKTAVRDALIAAQARGAGRQDRAYQRSWLYSRARAECRRHGPAPAADGAEPPVRSGGEPASVAWNTAMS